MQGEVPPLPLASSSRPGVLRVGHQPEHRTQLAWAAQQAGQMSCRTLQQQQRRGRWAPFVSFYSTAVFTETGWGNKPCLWLAMHSGSNNSFHPAAAALLPTLANTMQLPVNMLIWPPSSNLAYPILQEVDREHLSQTVLKLISSVASTAPTDDKSREAVIWHPAAVAVNTQSLNDPLGFGKIDVVNLRLVSRGSNGAVDQCFSMKSAWIPNNCSEQQVWHPTCDYNIIQQAAVLLLVLNALHLLLLLSCWCVCAYPSSLPPGTSGWWCCRSSLAGWGPGTHQQQGGNQGMGEEKRAILCAVLLVCQPAPTRACCRCLLSVRMHEAHHASRVHVLPAC